jgi:2-oxoglutarate dehydrogenase E1 component
LRHPRVVSSIDELANGRFERILADLITDRADAVSRILLCSGKIYFELEQARERLQRRDVAILRAEQLYPLSNETLEFALRGYKEGTPIFWVQEEPENMGAWRYFRVRFCDKLLGRFPFSGITRPASASPATGSHSAHKKEQEQLISEAFS